MTGPTFDSMAAAVQKHTRPSNSGPAGIIRRTSWNPSGCLHLILFYKIIYYLQPRPGNYSERRFLL